MEIDKDADAPAVKCIIAVEGWVIMVTNLHEEASEEDVAEFFGEWGTVQNLHLNLDRRTGYVKGYALIEYKTADEAERAVSEANGEDFLERKMTVDFAFVAAPDLPQSFRGGKNMATQRDRSRSPDR